MSLACPRCRTPLGRAPRGAVEEWSCASCGGRALRLHRLRRAAPREFAEAVEDCAAAGGRRGDTRCFACQMHLVAIRPRVGDRTWALDFCDECGIVWFDRGEAESARGDAPPPPPDPDHDRPSSVPRYRTPDWARDSVSVAADFPEGGIAPNLPLYAGFASIDGGAPWHRPWITWAAMAAIAAASVAGLVAGVESVARAWGFVPADPFRDRGAGFVASAFLHHDLLHLLVNLYYLALIGPRAEDLLRPGRFALILLLAVVGGNLAYLLFSPGSRVPAIGCGPAITAALTLFALSWPSARLRSLEWVYFSPVRFEFSATTALVVWVGINAAAGLFLSAGKFGVPDVAHVGAAAVGAGFWMFDRGFGLKPARAPAPAS